MTYSNIVKFLEEHLLPCSIKSLTGTDCPGCGMQRAMIELLKGNFIESFYLNPGLTGFVITFLFCLLHLKFGFTNGARVVVVLFVITVSLMIVNFIVKLSCSL